MRRVLPVALLVLVLLACAACKDDGDGGEREAMDMADVYYILGEGFGDEFAALWIGVACWLLGRRRKVTV